jgi:hypothetical protein
MTMDKNIKKYMDIRSGKTTGPIHKIIKNSITNLENNMTIWFKINFVSEPIKNTYKMQIKSIRKLYINNKDKYYIILFYVIMVKNYFKVEYHNRLKSGDKINHSENINKFRQLIEEMVKDIENNVSESALFNKLIGYLNYLQNPKIDQTPISEKILGEDKLNDIEKDEIEKEEVVVND